MNWFRNIFTKTEEEPMAPFLDFSELKVDMHSHLIPGIDDGARSMDESIAMLAKFESLGYSKVITTPHVMGDFFKNTPEIILGGLEELKVTASKLGIQLEIEAAAEYYYDDSLMRRLLNKEPLLTFGEKYVLFEFSFHSSPENTDALIFEMLAQGYVPVLAHFERYGYFHGTVERAKKWREQGVKIQLNINSLSGHYGKGIQQQAERLVDSREVDFVASDCHRIDHLLKMEKHKKGHYFRKLMELDLLNHTL